MIARVRGKSRGLVDPKSLRYGGVGLFLEENQNASHITYEVQEIVKGVPTDPLPKSGVSPG
jgi:hypothetical protein